MKSYKLINKLTISSWVKLSILLIVSFFEIWSKIVEILKKLDNDKFDSIFKEKKKIVGFGLLSSIKVF